MTEKRGRPRTFDHERVLEIMQDLFWRAGYLGTSYSDMCKASGLTKPSLYAAFGNKEETFLAALDLYVQRVIRPGIDLLADEPDAQKGIRQLLLAIVDGLTLGTPPKGCMIATNLAATSAHDVPEVIRSALENASRQTPDAVRAYLHSCAPSTRPESLSADDLADFIAVLIPGLAARAKQGASKEELASVVQTATKLWQL